MSDETKEASVAGTAERQQTEGQLPESTASETEVREAEAKQFDFEKELQRERSQRGREIKALNNTLEEMKSMLQNLSASKPASQAEYDDEILTVSTLNKVLSTREQQKAQYLKNYEDKFIDTLAKLGVDEGLEDDEMLEVHRIVRESFNVSYSGYKDPTADAERNFFKAIRVFERGKQQKPSLKLKGDNPKGTGIGGGTKMTDKETKMPELDEHAKAYVASRGKSNDWVKKTLGGN